MNRKFLSATLANVINFLLSYYSFKIGKQGNYYI